ncbi:MAG: hypothetical protein HOV80_13370, partial [Polyangiaceae bacterium]|nr:hypothetical protein [Polyangiaceae bacterium]
PPVPELPRAVLNTSQDVSTAALEARPTPKPSYLLWVVSAALAFAIAGIVTWLTVQNRNEQAAKTAAPAVVTDQPTPTPAPAPDAAPTTAAEATAAEQAHEPPSATARPDAVPTPARPVGGHRGGRPAPPAATQSPATSNPPAPTNWQSGPDMGF